MEKALGALKQIRTSFDPLYAVLDEDQKATLERLTRRGHHGHHDDDRDEMPRKALVGSRWTLIEGASFPGMETGPFCLFKLQRACVVP